MPRKFILYLIAVLSWLARRRVTWAVLAALASMTGWAGDPIAPELQELDRRVAALVQQAPPPGDARARACELHAQWTRLKGRPGEKAAEAPQIEQRLASLEERLGACAESTPTTGPNAQALKRVLVGTNFTAKEQEIVRAFQTMTGLEAAGLFGPVVPQAAAEIEAHNRAKTAGDSVGAREHFDRLVGMLGPQLAGLLPGWLTGRRAGARASSPEVATHPAASPLGVRTPAQFLELFRGSKEELISLDGTDGEESGRDLLRVHLRDREADRYRRRWPG